MKRILDFIILQLTVYIWININPNLLKKIILKQWYFYK